MDKSTPIEVKYSKFHESQENIILKSDKEVREMDEKGEGTQYFLTLDTLDKLNHLRRLELQKEYQKEIGPINLMSCKHALHKSDGNWELAWDWLKKERHLKGSFVNRK